MHEPPRAAVGAPARACPSVEAERRAGVASERRGEPGRGDPRGSGHGAAERHEEGPALRSHGGAHRERGDEPVHQRRLARHREGAGEGQLEIHPRRGGRLAGGAVAREARPGEGRRAELEGAGAGVDFRGPRGPPEGDGVRRDPGAGVPEHDAGRVGAPRSQGAERAPQRERGARAGSDRSLPAERARDGASRDHGAHGPGVRPQRGLGGGAVEGLRRRGEIQGSPRARDCRGGHRRPRPRRRPDAPRARARRGRRARRACRGSGPR